MALCVTDGYATVEFEGHTWHPFSGDTSIFVSEDRLHVEGTYCCLFAKSDVDLSNVSLRSQVRLEEGLAVGLSVRDESHDETARGYYTLLSPTGNVVMGINGPGTIIERAETEFNPIEEDLWMQIDAFDDDLKVYVWRPGDPFPRSPTLEVEDSTTLVPGSISLSLLANSSWPGPGTYGTGSFQSVQVANSTIYLHGDLNTDSVLDGRDIDALSAQVKAESHDVRYDLTKDNRVNQEDREVWVHDIKSTWFGDANLDGEFGSGDFVEVFQAGKYETMRPAGWAEGDWNGDMVFDSVDFLIAFQEGGYERGPLAAVMDVSEPEGPAIVISILVMLGAIRIKKSPANQKQRLIN